MSKKNFLIVDFILHPSHAIETLRDKSWLLVVILTAINMFLFGFNWSVSHFVINFQASLFWLVVIYLGALTVINLVTFLGVYYGLARAGKEHVDGETIKVLAYDYNLALIICNVIEVVVIFLLYIGQQYWLSVMIYDAAHVALLLWIAVFGSLAVQLIEKQSEFRSSIKVWVAIFVMFIVSTIFYLLVGADLISNIVR